jgi:hypothetical protein
VYILKRHTKDNGCGRLVLTSDEFERFVLETHMVLEQLGVRLVLPEALRQVLVPRLVRRAKLKDDAGSTRVASYLKLIELLTFEACGRGVAEGRM